MSKVKGAPEPPRMVSLNNWINLAQRRVSKKDRDDHDQLKNQIA